MFNAFVKPYMFSSVSHQTLGKRGNPSVELILSLQYNSWVSFNVFIQQVFPELLL